MQSVSSIPFDLEATIHLDSWPDAIDEDARWLLTQKVVASRHFARSPLLSKFLLYIVRETLEGRPSEITEHQIGVQVFGRPATYRTVEDNIVRNYARQLRKRLHEHFTADTTAGDFLIEVPLGAYVPVFTFREETTPQRNLPAEEAQTSALTAGETVIQKPIRSLWKQRRVQWNILLLIAYSAVIVCGTWLVVSRRQTNSQTWEPAQPLWHAMLGGASYVYIVPPDAGLNLLEDLSHRSLPLAEYLRSGYLQIPLPNLDNHSETDLRTQQFTDFIDTQIVASFSRLPEYNPKSVFLRFPRDLRLDDLKSANALILGSVCSNPWAAIADTKANFRIVCNQGMENSSIVNEKPLPGEETSYVSHWNEPTHVTYALISFVPNLSGDGHLLLLEGLDVAGTQAAAEAVLSKDAIVPVLKRAARPDGSLRSFEVLLKSTSIQSNATDTQIVASRIN